MGISLLLVVYDMIIILLLHPTLLPRVSVHDPRLGELLRQLVLGVNV